MCRWNGQCGAGEVQQRAASDGFELDGDALAVVAGEVDVAGDSECAFEAGEVESGVEIQAGQRARTPRVEEDAFDIDEFRVAGERRRRRGRRWCRRFQAVITGRQTELACNVEIVREDRQPAANFDGAARRDEPIVAENIGDVREVGRVGESGRCPERGNQNCEKWPRRKKAAIHEMPSDSVPAPLSLLLPLRICKKL